MFSVPPAAAKVVSLNEYRSMRGLDEPVLWKAFCAAKLKADTEPTIANQAEADAAWWRWCNAFLRCA